MDEQAKDERPPRFGVLVIDKGNIRWSSRGAMSLEDATEDFATWDRSTGEDNHRVFAIGVYPWTEMAFVEQVGTFLTAAFAAYEGARKRIDVLETTLRNQHERAEDTLQRLGITRKTPF